jgi:hypothetical protein
VWKDLWQYVTSTPATATLSVLVVGTIALIAISLLLKWRESNKRDLNLTQSSLKDFEEMRLEGDLSDAEYRNITALVRSKNASKGTIVDAPVLAQPNDADENEATN